jgi:serine/threonine protein kinase
MLSLEGRQLGNYKVVRRIRSGGMGAVYEGRQLTAFDRRVAIKVILGNYADDPDMRRRFAREAKTIARLHHPHILPLIEFGDEQGLLYLVMPFIEGGTLTGYLRRHLPDVHEVSTIFLQLLDAVEYAHDEGLIHRDIKSSNVLLESRRSGPPYAYLADFGLVRTIQQVELESSYAGTPIPLDQVPGTPHYMAPEQTWGVVTPATDIYALGVLLYQMLTGELPYNDPDDIEVIKMQLHAPVPNPCDTDASIPAELGFVVTRAMAKHAEQRFANIGEFREAFLAAVDGPVARVESLPFVDEPEEDFAVHELPPHPPLHGAPPKSPRASQQLRLLPPEPIEFAGSPPAGGRRRITGDQNEAPLPPAGARRQRITGENDEPPRTGIRQRITGDGDGLPRRGARRQRVATGELANAASIAMPGSRSLSRQIAPAGPRPLPARTLRSHRPRRFTFAVILGIAVPVLLILLLLLPRLFGLTLFPAGIPLFGSSPVATISLSVKTANERDTFLLTASPSATKPDVGARVLPDRSATSSASQSRTVATSGLQSSGGTRATGFLLFDNSSHTPIGVSAGSTFTASGGVQIRLERSVMVPPRSNGIDGRVSGPAEAVVPGDNGNIPPGALNSPCCSSFITVSNPNAFSGGSNASVTHLVTQGDLDGVKNELTPGLQRKALRQISGQLQPNEVQAGTPSYTVNVSSDHPVGAAATQVTVTVTVSATALVYNTRIASDLARQLLTNEASQSLGPNYQPHDNLSIATPTVEQQSSDGRLYLSIAASGLWAYTITARDEELWRQNIKGASVTLAQSYLSTRPGITAVRISLPFGTDHLPTDETQIVFVLAT